MGHAEKRPTQHPFSSIEKIVDRQCKADLAENLKCCEDWINWAKERKEGYDLFVTHTYLLYTEYHMW